MEQYIEIFSTKKLIIIRIWFFYTNVIGSVERVNNRNVCRCRPPTCAEMNGRGCCNNNLNSDLVWLEMWKYIQLRNGSRTSSQKAQPRGELRGASWHQEGWTGEAPGSSASIGHAKFFDFQIIQTFFTIFRDPMVKWTERKRQRGKIAHVELTESLLIDPFRSHRCKLKYFEYTFKWQIYREKKTDHWSPRDNIWLLAFQWKTWCS